jgi:hypothetical protein
LEKETQRNMELIWLIGNLQPDFKTISDFRRDNKDILKEFSKGIKLFLKDKNLISLEIVAQDGTKLKANAKKEMLSEQDIISNLEKLEQELDEYLTEMDERDERESKQGSNCQLAEKDAKIAELEKKLKVWNHCLSKRKKPGKTI